MTSGTVDSVAASPLLIVAGAVLLVEGAMLVGDLGGARRWWIEYSARQRELFGRWIGPRYDDVRTIRLGIFHVLLGLAFLAVGVLN